MKRRQVLSTATAATTALLLARAGAQITAPTLPAPASTHPTTPTASANPPIKPPSGVLVCKLADLTAAGDAIRFKLPRARITYGVAVRVNQPVEGGLKAGTEKSPLYVHAYTLECTHLGCELDTPRVRLLDELVLLKMDSTTSLECSCHGSKFDGLSGKVTASPALRDLERLTLERRGDELWALG